MDFEALYYLGHCGAGPGEKYYYGLVLYSKGFVDSGKGYKYAISLIRYKKAPIGGVFIPTFVEYAFAENMPVISFKGKLSKIEYWVSDDQDTSTKAIAEGVPTFAPKRITLVEKGFRW